MKPCNCKEYHPPKEGFIGCCGIPSIAGQPKDICGCCDGVRPFQKPTEGKKLQTK